MINQPKTSIMAGQFIFSPRVSPAPHTTNKVFHTPPSPPNHLLRCPRGFELDLLMCLSTSPAVEVLRRAPAYLFFGIIACFGTGFGLIGSDIVFFVSRFFNLDAGTECRHQGGVGISALACVANPLGQLDVFEGDRAVFFELTQININGGRQISGQTSDFKVVVQLADNLIMQAYSWAVLAVQEIQRYARGNFHVVAYTLEINVHDLRLVGVPWY